MNNKIKKNKNKTIKNSVDPFFNLQFHSENIFHYMFGPNLIDGFICVSRNDINTAQPNATKWLNANKISPHWSVFYSSIPISKYFQFPPFYLDEVNHGDDKTLLDIVFYFCFTFICCSRCFITLPWGYCALVRNKITKKSKKYYVRLVCVLKNVQEMF